MASNTRRGLVTALELAGVDVSQRSPAVSDGIQLVYIMDDLSLLAPPLRRPQFYMSEVTPVNVIRRSFLEISAPPDSAIIVPWVRNDDSNDIIYGVEPLTQITNDLDVAVPDISLGGVSRALAQEGTGAAAGGILLAAGAEWPVNQPPMVLRPGDVLYFTQSTINLAVRVTMAWREIPVAAPSTPA